MKKMKPIYLRRLLCSLLLLMAAMSANASHIVGVDLFYTWQSGNTYKITLIAYGDCGSAAITSAFGTLSFASPQICIFDGNTNITSISLTIQPPTAGVEITPVCPADINLTQCTSTSYSIPGIKKFVYTGTYTVPYASAVWRFLFLGYMGGTTSSGTPAGAGRAAAITNITTGSVIQLVDTLNNMVYHNSSPLLTVVPTPFFCLDNSDNYNPGAVDPDGDSLSFYLVPGMNTGTAASTTCVPGGPVSYVPPYTATAPLAATSFAFDPATGQISFYPNALQRSLVVYNVEEYRSGTFVGTSQREMTFLVLTCTNTAPSGGFISATTGTIDDTTHYHICQNSGVFSIYINPSESDVTNNITVASSGLPTGLTLSTTGNGTPTPHITISGSSTTLAPGSYTFYITYSDNNCPLAGTQTLAYTITIVPAPAITETLISAATCVRKAAVSILPSGLGGPWVVKVSSAPGDTIQTFTPVSGTFTDSLSPGTYSITIFSSSQSCSNYVSVTIAEPTLTTPTGTFTNPTYCGASDGTITLYHLVPGSTDTVKFYYNGFLAAPQPHVVASDSTIKLTGLAAGVYSNITITYGYCVSSPVGPYTLVNPAFTMRALTDVNPTWCGFCNGSVTLYGLHPGQTDTISYTLGGVAQPPVYHLIAADSTVTISSLCPGTYANFIAKTDGVCVSNTLGPVILTVPPFTMRAITFTNPSYCGICDGTITLYGLHPGQLDTINYTLGGVAQPPVIQLIGSDSMVILTGLCPGTYANFIAKTDGICISNTLGPVTLTVPPFTMRAITFTNPDYCGVCNGTITLYGLHPGETDTIHYTYDGIAQTPIVHLIGSDSTVVLTGLCAGVYANFIATTGGICTSNTLGPVTLTVPPFTMRAITFTNPAYCGICNGTITLYGLHPGELDTINYTYNGVAQPEIIQLIPSDSMVVLTGLCSGVYANFIAKTGGVCISNTLGPVTLTVPPFTMRAISFTNPDYCGICNGTITLYGLHPGEIDTINYTYNGIAQTPVVQAIGTDSTVVITGLCAGVYANFVANTGGVCISNTLGPVTLSVPPFVMRAIGFTNPDYCGVCNGTITLYGLHPGEIDTINYTYNGVAQPPLTFTIGADSTVSLTGLCFGTYANFVANTGGVCVSNTLGPVDLTVPPFTIRALSYTNPTKCGFCDGTITIYGAHPGELDTLNYTINGVPQTAAGHLIAADSTIILSGLCEGIYGGFTVSTGGVCVSNVLGPDTLKAPPIIPGFTYTIHEGCNGDTLVCTNTSTPASQLTYTWEFGDGGTDTATNPVHIYYSPGTYNIILNITNTRCVASDTQTITLNNLINAAFTDVPDSFVCQGSPVTFTNSSIGTLLNYNWYFGDGTTDNTTNATHIYTVTGNYQVMLVVANYVPCHDTVIKNLAVDSISAISIAASDSAICRGQAISFTGIYSALGNTGVIWTFGDSSEAVINVNPVTHSFAGTGPTSVTVEALYRACPDTSATLSIYVIPYPSINLGPDTSICPGSSMIILTDPHYPESSGASWLWNTGQTSASIEVVQPGVYYATVSVGGCPATDSVVVLNDCYLDIPNAFSPNGDGVNDYFFPRQLLSKSVTDFHMSIFNRWGQLIFETSNLDGIGWDGKFNGVMQPEGVFIYVIDANFKDGEKEHRQGNITLLH